MRIKKFEFIEALVCSANWYDVNENTTSQQRLTKVEELWIRYNAICESDPSYAKVDGMIRYINETIYSES